MKIIVAASTFPGHKGDSVPAFVAEQVCAMKKLYPRIEFIVAAPHYRHTPNYVEHETYQEYHFHYFWPHRYEQLAGRGIIPALQQKPWLYLQIPFLLFFEARFLYRLTKWEQPDCLYAHWFTPQGINAAIVSMLTKTPYVFTTHASDVAVWQKVPFLGGIIVRFFASKARGVTAVSRRSLAKLRYFFNDRAWQKFESKVKLIPMGVDLKSFSKPHKTAAVLKLENGLSGKTVLLFIGRLAEKKGVRYLLEAFATLTAKHPDTHLIIGGDGPLRPELEAQAEKLGLNDRCSFIGFISGSRKNDYFHLSDILVLPSIVTAGGDAEGLPVVLMEGLAAGKICVATDVSGADDIISDGRSGYLIPPADARALAEKLEKVLTMSKAKKERLADHARVVAKRFDWPQLAKEHYEFLFKSH